MGKRDAQGRARRLEAYALAPDPRRAVLRYGLAGARSATRAGRAATRSFPEGSLRLRPMPGALKSRPCCASRDEVKRIRNLERLFRVTVRKIAFLVSDVRDDRVTSLLDFHSGGGLIFGDRAAARFGIAQEQPVPAEIAHLTEIELGGGPLHCIVISAGNEEHGHVPGFRGIEEVQRRR